MPVAAFSIPSICAIVVTLIASVIDVRTTKIPNLLTFPSAALGIILNFALNGVQAGLWAIGGYFIGVAIMILPGLLTKKTVMGFGDAKLIGAIGAFLGWRVIIVWGFFSLLYGGFAFIKFLALLPWKQMGKMVQMVSVGAPATIDEQSAKKLNEGMNKPIPLAPFIALGTILAIILEQQVLVFLGFAK